MLHKLKIDPLYFEAKKQGLKMFEIRDNKDRGFQKGDYVEYSSFKDGFYINTEEVINTTILYVTNYNQKEGFVVYGEAFCK